MCCSGKTPSERSFPATLHLGMPGLEFEVVLRDNTPPPHQLRERNLRRVVDGWLTLDCLGPPVLRSADAGCTNRT